MPVISDSTFKVEKQDLLSLPREISRRIFRKVVWPSPKLYAVCCLFRQMRPLIEYGDYDVWVGGFPRSSNTYTMTILEEAFSLHGRVAHRLHFPPHVIHALRSCKPGFFLIRKPLDAIISWAQFNDFPLEHCINAYIDTHLILLPYVDTLHIVQFDSVVNDAKGLIEFCATVANLSVAEKSIDYESIFKKIEDRWTDRDGNIIENRVARPSKLRAAQKPELLNQIQSNPAYQKKLEKCEQLYAVFLSKKSF